MIGRDLLFEVRYMWVCQHPSRIGRLLSHPSNAEVFHTIKSKTEVSSRSHKENPVFSCCTIVTSDWAVFEATLNGREATAVLAEKKEKNQCVWTRCPTLNLITNSHITCFWINTYRLNILCGGPALVRRFNTKGPRASWSNILPSQTTLYLSIMSGHRCSSL